MQIGVLTAGEDGAQQLDELLQWLRADTEFRGRVTVLSGPEPTGAMGLTAQALEVLIGQAGLGGALIAVVIAWLRNRTGDVGVTITRSDESTSVEITASRVKALTAPQVHELASQLLTQLMEVEDVRASAKVEEEVVDGDR